MRVFGLLLVYNVPRTGVLVIKLPKIVEEWCENHEGCNGCKFLGAECVAPQSNVRYVEWLNNMIRLIKIED